MSQHNPQESPQSVVKRAIELQTGDQILSESDQGMPVGVSGTVENTVIVDKGVQVKLKGGGTFVRPEDHHFQVAKQS